MAVLAPIPRASDSAATDAKTGFRRSVRSAKRTSSRMVAMAFWTGTGRSWLANDPTIRLHRRDAEDAEDQLD